MMRVVLFIALAAAAVPFAHAQPSAAPLLGSVGYTTVVCTGTEQGDRAIGEDIYGPFEAGFSSQQDGILAGMGCSTGQGYVDGGIDTATAESIVARDCIGATGSLSRSIIDSCGGHTPEYHFHEPKVSCCGDNVNIGHSLRFGDANDGKGIYGPMETNTEKPTLDACGGHWGPTPDQSADSYHYHIQDKAPFTVGCFGPNADGSTVSLAQCKALYEGCSSTAVTYNVQTGSTWPMTSSGTVSYKLWCPCYDSDGSNTGSTDSLGGAAAPASTAPPVEAISTSTGGGMGGGTGGSGMTRPSGSGSGMTRPSGSGSGMTSPPAPALAWAASLPAPAPAWAASLPAPVWAAPA